MYEQNSAIQNIILKQNKIGVKVLPLLCLSNRKFVCTYKTNRNTYCLTNKYRKAYGSIYCLQ